MNPESKSPALCVVSGGAPPGAAQSRLRALAADRGWRVTCIDAADPQVVDEQAALVLSTAASGAELKPQFPHALVVSVGDSACTASDLVVASDAGEAVLVPLLGHAEEHWRGKLKVMELFREVGARRRRMGQLSDIALSLSTQMDFDDLLETILLEARRLAGCDAGSLYLIDETEATPTLIFKLAQNDSIETQFREQRLPLSTDSLAGYVAQSGQSLEIPDAYAISEDAPYRFNRSFDEQTGYRTRSILVMPMRDHRGKVVGVLQFINRMDPTRDEPIPFGEEIADLLRAVGSQAAVSIQKNLLIRDINRLFEGFVQASVKAIEQRDPTTSGHSFRVAESTLALLQILPASNNNRFRGLSFSESHLKEVRYAALLHDFGKVGVPENILLKANKLSDERLEIIQHRLELQKERLRRRAVEKELELLHHPGADHEVARRRVRRELASQLSVLDAYFECIGKANRPSLLEDGDFQNLREIREYAYREFDGSRGGLINDADLLALSVRKGSLTPQERREIQAHVTHTRDFLAVLPWPPELAQVPDIAAAHHEKLDGSGYPNGLLGEQIPLPSRVMAVCDIYDALTAMDRPYKSAVSADHALAILTDEARLGLLDQDLVQIFIDGNIYRSAWPQTAQRAS